MKKVIIHRPLSNLPLEDDYWRWNLNLNKAKVNNILSRVNCLLEHHRTLGNLRHAAIQFILNHPGACSCIVGHRDIREVVENIRSSEHLIQVANRVESDNLSVELLG